jgi:hypothetical protein
MTNRRINEVIGIRYDDIAKIPAIITEVEAMLKAHKEIDQSHDDWSYAMVSQLGLRQKLS